MNNFLGATDSWQFLILIAYALIGVAVNLLYNAADRNPANPTTPYHFSLSFLTLDNLKRLVLNLILIFLSVRFYPDLFGKPISPFLATGVGFIYDKIMEVIKNKTELLSVNRTKIIPPKTPMLPPKTIVVENK